jgi:hypothetical protein
MFHVFVVWTAASARSSSLVQRGPTQCVCLIVCFIESLTTMNRSRPDWSCFATKKRLAQVELLMIYIREVPGSNLGRDDYTG